MCYAFGDVLVNSFLHELQSRLNLRFSAKTWSSPQSTMTNLSSNACLNYWLRAVAELRSGEFISGIGYKYGESNNLYKAGSMDEIRLGFNASRSARELIQFLMEPDCNSIGENPPGPNQTLRTLCGRFRRLNSSACCHNQRTTETQSRLARAFPNIGSLHLELTLTIAMWLWAQPYQVLMRFNRDGTL